MNRTHMTGTSFFSGTSRPEPARPGSPPRLTGLVHPDEVVDDPWLTPTQKREVLASWASDVRAVPDAPALHQLDNGAVVRISEILQALRSLDKREGSSWPFTGRRIRFPSRPNPASRQSWPDDDDDPPPCPALIARPPGGPLSGGAAADPGLALAA